MMIKNIRYYQQKIPGSRQEIVLLSDWLKDCPCKTNTEYFLDNSGLGTSMSYCLMTRTFLTQDDLDQTWNKLKDLVIQVEFQDTFEQPYVHIYDFKTDFQIYSAAKGDRDVVCAAASA